MGSKRNFAAFVEGIKPYMNMILQQRIRKQEQADQLKAELQKEQRMDVKSGAAVETAYRPQSIADTRPSRDPLSLLPGFNVTPPAAQALPGPRRGGFPAGLPTSMPSRTAMPTSMSGKFMTSRQEPGAFRQAGKEYQYLPKLTEEQVRAKARGGYTQTAKYGPRGLSEGHTETKEKEKGPTLYQQAALTEKARQYNLTLEQRKKEGLSSADCKRIKSLIAIMPYKPEVDSEIMDLLGVNEEQTPEQARAWLKSNPNDPYAPQIRQWLEAHGKQ